MSCCLLAMWCQDIAMTMLRRVSSSPRCLLFSFCRAVTPVSCLVHVQLTCFSVSDAALFCLLGFPFASQTVGNEAKLCWPAVTCWGAQNSMGECLHATAAAAAAAAHRVLLLPLYFFFLLLLHAGAYLFERNTFSYANSVETCAAEVTVFTCKGQQRHCFPGVEML